MRILFLLTALILTSIPYTSSALVTAESYSGDSRIKVIRYNPYEVFKYKGYVLYQTLVQFEEDESIQTISIGDSETWKIVPSGNRLFIKPLSQDADTNMAVVTDKRVYNFELSADSADSPNDGEIIFALHFDYSEDEISTDTEFKIQKRKKKEEIPDLTLEPHRYNQNYSISGAQTISPIRIFDDGEFTYFEFANRNAIVPAFFMVDSYGEESIINYRTLGNYIVVERVTSQFTLRNGKEVACVFNETMPLPKLPEE